MPEQVEAQPVADETQSQEQQQEEFGIFDQEKPEAQPEAEKQKADDAAEPEKGEKYEELSRLTADMLELKQQNAEMRKLLEAERDETVDDLDVVNSILSDIDERTPEEIRYDELKSELEGFKAEQQKMLAELQNSQRVSWASTEIKEIDRHASKLAEELPWVDVARKMNPSYSDMVLQRRAELSTTGQDVSYQDLIRQSNDQIKEEYMGMLDKMLSVPAAKTALLEKLGVKLDDKPTEPARASEPSPTLHGGLSTERPAAEEFEDDEAAFEAAVALMQKDGYRAG